MTYLKNIDDELLKKEIIKFFESAPKIYLPSISINTVIFSFDGLKLKVLLLRFGNTTHLMLPGGYVMKEEPVDDAARRILQTTTNLNPTYLDQFYTSGSTPRTDESIIEKTLQTLAGDIPHPNWFSQRFVSVCYYAIVDEKKVNIVPDPFSTEYKWVDTKKVPKLLFDHSFIIKKAINALQTDIEQKMIAPTLLDEPFTMNELQNLYEAVFQKKLIRTNFQRKMLSMNVLERLEKRYSGKAHKAPFVYRFVNSKRS